MGIRHTITITFESNEELLNHPILEMAAADMTAQLKSSVETISQVSHRIVSEDRTDFLSESVRETLCEELADEMMHGLFGGGIEDDYVCDGYEITGVYQMSDHQLVSEAEDCLKPDNEKLMEAIAEREVHNMLRNK